MALLPATFNTTFAALPRAASPSISPALRGITGVVASAPYTASAASGGKGFLSGMSGDSKAQLGAAGVMTLGQLLASLFAYKSSGKAAKSQEQISREQIASQEKILADQLAAQAEYNKQLERQFMAQQANERLAREVQQQQFERSQGFQERQYDERKAAARPYYDYVWNYLNTPVK